MRDIYPVGRPKTNTGEASERGQHTSKAPKPAGTHASQIVAIKWHDTERAKLAAAARALGTTVSDFVREAAMKRASLVLGGSALIVADIDHSKVALQTVLPNELADLVYRPAGPGMETEE